MQMTSQITYREALRVGLNNVLKNDEKAFLIGEDVGAYGGSYAVSKNFFKDFGEDKIIDAPLSELGFTGLGIGAAMGGLKPIVEIMTVNFSLLALDQIVNSAATLRYMSGGQISLPLVIRMTTGGGRQLAAQHSNSLEGWIAHIPGLKVLVPSTIEDARYMLEYAVNDPNPVLIFEHASLLNSRGECSEKMPEDYSPYQAKVQRSGDQLTLITYGGMLPRSLASAEELHLLGHEVEVIDLRSLRPLDDQTIFNSIKKTHRALIVDEGWKTCSFSAEISARIMESLFHELRLPVERLCRREVPTPYAKNMEEVITPQTKDITKKLKEMLQ